MPERLRRRMTVMGNWLRPLGLALAVALVACVYGAAFSAETPVGALKGRLLAGDTGHPLAGIRVVVRPAKPASGEDRHTQRTKPDGTFRFDNLPVGVYEVEPQTSAYEDKGHAAQVQEAAVTTLDLRLKPGDPYLNVEVHNRA